jgi:hypothetical protein
VRANAIPFSRSGNPAGRDSFAYSVWVMAKRLNPLGISAATKKTDSNSLSRKQPESRKNQPCTTV